MKFTLYRIIGERPDVPDYHIIFNAPRPLYGEFEWQGDYRHGIFYASLNPKTKHGKLFIEKNHELDAWLVEYISAGVAIHEIRELYLREYPVEWDNFISKETSKEELIEAWYNNSLHITKKEII
jgi:hypothetical protein